jgi:hypothetical protein
VPGGAGESLAGGEGVGGAAEGEEGDEQGEHGKRPGFGWR